MAVLTEYLWIAVVGTFTGFLYAAGIGANDVANAFASTVASGSLTCKQAVMVAAVFEFCGAFFLGASVTSTIRSKVFDTKLYKNTPELIMLGNMTSLITATVMLFIATYLGWPVSTTHTIVGCLMGFSIAAKGFSSINWTIVKQIFISWVASPLVSGAVAFVFFGLIRMFVMRSEHAFTRAILVFPIVLFFGISIDLWYILQKGISNKATLGLEVTLPVACGTGLACGLLWLVVFGPIVKRRIEAKRALENDKLAEPAEELEEGAQAKTVGEGDKNEEETDKPEGDIEVGEKAKESTNAEEVVDVAVKKSLGQRFADATYGQDLKGQSFHESHRAEVIWDDAEQFDPDAEELFTYVQVFTACLNSFAHGANDVANAIAPISGLIYIYQTGTLASKSPVQKWILAYGGIGIVVGLLLYGYNVMKSLGYKMTALSPSRGSCAELSASLFVVTASFLGIPVSSTQSICGAVAGVGLCGGVRNVEWWFLLQVCLSWVFVFFAAVILSAGLFSFCAYSPSIV